MAEPFVGRGAELASIAELCGRARADARPAGVLVVEPPGCGKSRLLAEVDASLAGCAHLRVVGYEPERAVPLAAASGLLQSVARQGRRQPERGGERVRLRRGERQQVVHQRRQGSPRPENARSASDSMPRARSTVSSSPPRRARRAARSCRSPAARSPPARQRAPAPPRGRGHHPRQLRQLRPSPDEHEPSLRSAAGLLRDHERDVGRAPG
jgi:hypothetical protein